VRQSPHKLTRLPKVLRTTNVQSGHSQPYKARCNPYDIDDFLQSDEDYGDTTEDGELLRDTQGNKEGEDQARLSTIDDLGVQAMGSDTTEAQKRTYSERDSVSLLAWDVHKK